MLSMIVSCQKPTEPDDPVPSVNVIVRVRDQSKNPVKDAEVRYRENITTQPSPFGTTGTGRTDVAGRITRPFDIPVSGRELYFDIKPPTDPDFDSATTITDARVVAGCIDSIYEFTIPRRQQLFCNQLYPNERHYLQLCRVVKPRDTVCTRRFRLDCPMPTQISVTPAILTFPGGTLLLRYNDSFQAPGTSSITLRTPVDECEICMVYDAQPNRSVGNTAVRVTASPNGVPSYTLLDIDFVGESTCDSCTCIGSTTVDFPKTGTFDICLDSVGFADIDLSEISNTNSQCDLLFVPQQKPSNPAVQVESFNFGRSTISPGEKLGDLRLSIRPVATGPITEKLVYRVFSRSQSGTEIECGNLTINVRLNVIGPVCPLQLSGSLIQQSNPVITGTLIAEVCGVASGSVCVGNPGARCPLMIQSVRLFGPDASQFTLSSSLSLPLAVAPDQNRCLDVSFQPTRAYYLASGTPPRKIYNATLELVTSCDTTLIPLRGQIPDPRVPPLRLFPQGCAVNPNTGIRLMSDGSINIDQVPGNYLITVQSVNAAASPRTAILNITTPYTLLRSGLTDLTPLCSLGDDAATRAACGNTAASGPVQVREGEVYVFNYTYNNCDFCALLWIESIDDVSVTRTCPQVQFRICSPIIY